MCVAGGRLTLSLALPLSENQFDDFTTRSYFDNLLQERDTARADIIAKYRLSNDDLVGILFYPGPRGSDAGGRPGRLRPLDRFPPTGLAASGVLRSRAGATLP
ncbi:HipA N-terminal domain-containing protein [Devosia sp. Root635]|uniref:HipA N-terminal domain-containing protein n=1 Tax=Devosia sp. Root635 TaxID=1736575 RepID=UPI0039B784B2